MAIGRTFKEAFQKGLRGLEPTGPAGGRPTPADDRLQDESLETALAALRTPTPERVFQIKRAFQLGATVEAVAERSRIDPWFLYQMAELLEAEEEWKAAGPAGTLSPCARAARVAAVSRPVTTGAGPRCGR